MDNNFFAQLQALSTLTEDNTIEQSRQQLGEIVEFFRSRPDYLDLVTIFAEQVRNLKVETLLECDSFMVQDDFLQTEIPEELQHDSLGFCKGANIVFQGRYVYPVKDVKGQVMGFCGYDKYSEVKYLDSLNYGYKAKEYSLWGMERLPQYYDSNEPVYFIEGIVCALYLRQEGLQSLAQLGSTLSPYCTMIAKRFGTRAVFICDSDEAGTKFRQILHKRLPSCRIIQSKIAKDVDDSRLVDPDFVNELRRLKNPFTKSKLFS